MTTDNVIGKSLLISAAILATSGILWLIVNVISHR